MTTCVPIKELKNTTAFANLVESSEGEIIVTRNGCGSFVAMSLERLEALKMEAAQAELYRLMNEAERDVISGQVVDARESQRRARDHYAL